MLKNPMVLMMVFTAIMAFGVPKMMASMEIDPEMAKEVAEMREKAMNFQNTDWSEK
jgi:ER membrane protein complex subunit 7